MRGATTFQFLIVLGLASQLLGCPQGKLNKDGQTSSTLTPSGNILQTRLWSVSRDGKLQSLISSGSPVSVDWSTIDTFDGTPASDAGVSALSFAASNARHERVFYVDGNGRLRAHAVRNGSGLGIAVNNDVSIPTFAGPVSAVLLNANNRQRVAAITEDPATIIVFGNSSATSEQFSVLHNCAGAPQEISPASIVVGAARGSQFCFAAQGINGALSLCPSGDQSTPPNRTWQGGATAVAWNDGTTDRFDIMVRAVGPGTDETSIQHATWRNACTGQPQWSSVGTPPSGVAAGRYSVNAAIRNSATGVQSIVLVAAGNDGKLYQNRFVDKWGTWTEIAAPADTIGRLGGVHVSSQGGTFFVGDVSSSSLLSTAAGYVFEVSNGATLNHTDPVVGLVAASEGAGFPGAWTESSLAERNGKVIVGASVMSDASPASVALSYSLDDGHSWRKALVPHQYSALPNRYRTQGDPYAAMDSTGTGFVVLHELEQETNCATSPIVYSSKIYVAKTTNGTTISVDPIDDDWVDGLPSSTTAALSYLDHPTMAITSDDTQHYAWLLACRSPGNCPSNSNTIFYRRRNAGSSSYSAPIVVSGSSNIGLPYMFTDKDDKVFIAWANGDLHICPWNGNACSPNIINVTQPVNACAQALQFVNFRDQSTTLRLRSGGFAVAASGKDAGRIFTAFQFREGTLGTPNCSPGTAPFDIAFMESADSGVTWSNPIVVTTQLDEVGTDQVMPSLTSHDDGTVLLTYYDRSIDPNGSRVQQRVAIRHPNGTWDQHERRRDTNVTSDLALLPRKCGGQDRFIGDYHFAVGGKTHAHALRVDALRLENVDSVRLQASAFSGSAWR